MNILSATLRRLSRVTSAAAAALALALALPACGVAPSAADDAAQVADMQHTVTITAASLAALAPDGKLELSTADQVKYVFDASDGAIAFDRVILDSGKQKTPMSQVVEKIAADMGVTVAHLEERTFGVWAETLAASAPSEGDGAGNFLRMTYCYERIYYDDSTCQCVRYFDIAYLCGYAP